MEELETKKDLKVMKLTNYATKEGKKQLTFYVKRYIIYRDAKKN